MTSTKDPVCEMRGRISNYSRCDRKERRVSGFNVRFTAHDVHQGMRKEKEKQRRERVHDHDPPMDSSHDYSLKVRIKKN